MKTNKMEFNFKKKTPIDKCRLVGWVRQENHT